MTAPRIVLGEGAYLSDPMRKMIDHIRRQQAADEAAKLAERKAGAKARRAARNAAKAVLIDPKGTPEEQPQ